MFKSSWRVSLHFIGLLACAAYLSACGSTTTVVVGGTSTTGSTPSALPTATATPLPTCATLLPGAGPISSGGFTGFDDVPYPSGAVATAIMPSSSGDGLWAISVRDVCVAAGSAASVKSFYAAQMGTMGWTASLTYPLDGAYQADCNPASCWLKDKAPRYVGLETVTDHATLATYRLRLAGPPAEPMCQPYPFGTPMTPASYSATYDTASGKVPLPPLTYIRGQEGFADPGGSLQHLTVFLCSSGTPASITHFVQTELAAHGWALGSGPCGGKNVLVKNKVEVALGTASDPQAWQLQVSFC